MKKSLHIITLIVIQLLTFNIQLYSQNASKADELFTAGKYAEAARAYSSLHKQDTRNLLYIYRLARCADELGQVEEAIKWFEEAGEKYTLRNYYLGHLYFKTYRFEQAITVWEKYLQTIVSSEPNNPRIEELNTYIPKARKGQRLMKRVVNVPLLETTVMPKQEFLQAQAEYIYANERGDHQLTTLQVSKAQGSIAIETDTSSSIYQRERLLDEWAEWVSLPAPINTADNEMSPCLLGDGVTLYFASDRDGLGGYDIYMSRPTENGYLSPELLGFPFNSLGNDYMFRVDEAEGVAYIASDRAVADSLVCIYKIVWTGEMPLLHNADNETLRNVAMGFSKVDELQVTSDELQVTSDELTCEEIYFIVNDTIIYNSLDDFPTQETVEMFVAYNDLLQQIEEWEERLETLREAYAHAEEYAKQELGIEILTLEKALPAEHKRLSQMLYDLRLALSESEW